MNRHEPALSVTQAAYYLKCSIQTVRRALNDGLFPNAYRLTARPGSPWYIPKTDLDAMKEASKHRHTKPQDPEPTPPDTH